MQVRCPTCDGPADYVNGETRCQKCASTVAEQTTENENSFDPYHVWLGIPPKYQPPHHYRLLGLELYEADLQVIENAADRQMTHVRTVATGKHGHHSQDILNRISAARICLLNADRKEEYDASLRVESELAPLTPVSDDMFVESAPVGQVDPTPFPSPLSGPQFPASPMVVPPADPSSVPPRQTFGAAPPVKPRKPIRSNDPTVKILAIGLGAMGLVVTAGVGIWFAVQSSGNPAAVALPNGDSRNDTRPVGDRTVTDVSPPTTDVKPPKDKVAVSTTGVDTNSNRPTTVSQNTQPDVGTNDVATSDPMGNKSQLPSADPIPIKPVEVVQDPSEPDTPKPDTPSPSEVVEKPLVPSKPTLDPLPSLDDGEKKDPVPGEEERREKLVLLKEAFADEYAQAISKPGKQRLADTLLKYEGEVKDDQAMRYVILTQLYLLGVHLEDALMAEGAIEDVIAGYAVDNLRLRSQLLETAARFSKSPSNKRAIANSAISLFDIALHTEKFDEAEQVMELIGHFAEEFGDSAMKENNTARQTELEMRQTHFKEADQAAKRLAADPDDAAAYLALGKYLCAFRQNWDAGLEWLSKGSDPKLQHLAQQDFASDSFSEQIQVADGWYDVAKSQQSLAPFFSRSAFLYKQAVSRTSGIEQVKIQRRLEEIEPLVGATVAPSYVPLVEGFQVAQAAASASAEELVATAYEQARSDDFKRATRSLMKAASMNKQDLKNEFSLSLLYVAGMRDAAAAERRFEKCAQQPNLAAAALNNAALCELQLGKASEAIRHLKQSLEYSPPLPQAIHNALRLHRGVYAKKIAMPLTQKDELEALREAADKLGTSSDRSDGWLYVSADKDFSPKTGLVLEDHRCLICHGHGFVDCPNRKCSKGVVRVKKAQSFTEPVTGGTVTRNVSVPTTCRTCSGRGNQRCTFCSSGRATGY